jgi:hypothetical protein
LPRFGFCARVIASAVRANATIRVSLRIAAAVRFRVAFAPRVRFSARALMARSFRFSVRGAFTGSLTSSAARLPGCIPQKGDIAESVGSAAGAIHAREHRADGCEQVFVCQHGNVCSWVRTFATRGMPTPEATRPTYTNVCSCCCGPDQCTREARIGQDHFEGPNRLIKPSAGDWYGPVGPPSWQYFAWW